MQKLKEANYSVSKAVDDADTLIVLDFADLLIGQLQS